MPSLRYYLNSFGKKYLWGLEQTRSKIDVLSSNSMQDRETVDTASLEKLRKIIFDEPLVKKAIFKKNRDTFKNWFVIKDEEGKIIDDDTYKIITDFDKKVNFPNILYKAGISANIYGTGFIEKIYNEHAETSPITPVTNRKHLIGLHLLDSECISERKRNPNDDKDITMYPVYKSTTRSIEEKLIHPSRLEVVRIDSLPFSYFGVSVAKVLWNILKSKMNADVGSGELLNWYGRGMYDIEITGMTPDDQKRTEIQVKKHPDYLIHDERVKTTVVNPTRIDPAPFYDYFYTNIGASVEMPKRILTGANVQEGSEAGIGEYYSDIKNTQNLVYTPIIESIYKELLRSRGKKWDYNIFWNPILVDELSEAKILQSRSYSVTQLINAGVIDTKEARDIINVGIPELDIDKNIKKEVAQIPTPKTSNPNINPQPTIKRNYLTPAEREMIARQKEIGRLELLEQERRCKEALEKMKKHD